MPRKISDLHFISSHNKPRFSGQKWGASSTASFDGWEAGNADADLDRLEQGISKSNADNNLSQSLRLQCLDYMAQQRRPLSHLVPRGLVFAAAIGLWTGLLHQSSSGSSLAIRLTQLCGVAFSLQFWILMVWFPALLYWRLPRRSRQESTLGLDQPSSLRRFMLPSWRDPFAYSSQQIARHVVEHWMACASGLILFYPFIPVNSPWRHFTRLCVRIGIPVSWRLYESMWFLLHRPQQARPVTWSIHVLQLVTRQMLFSPLAVAWDAALWSQAIGCSGIIWTSILTCVLGIRTFLNVIKDLSQWRATKKVLSSLPIRLVVMASLGTYAGHCAWLHRHRLQRVAINLVQSPSLPLPHLLPALQAVAVVLACLPPLAYLMTRLSRVRVFYSRASSLAPLREALPIETGEEQKPCWRYRYEWLEKPQRVLVTLRRLRERFWYNLVLRGTVQDKLLREQSIQRREAFRASGTHILNRIEENQKQMPESFAVDRSLWKERAMDFQAKVHEQNWAQGNIDDPLGLALFLTTGVSLGLRFDQDRSMSEGETLSNRRLQARAVKSVIKQTRQIYSDAGDKVRALDATDQTERDRQIRDIRTRSDADLQRLSNRLTELIPTDGDLKGGRVEMFTAQIDWKKISKNNYLIQRKTGSGADLLENWRERYFASNADTTNSYDVIPMSTEIDTDIGNNRTDNKLSNDDETDLGSNRTLAQSYTASEDIDPSVKREVFETSRTDSDGGLTRRDAIRRTATLLAAGTLIGGSTVKHEWEKLQQSSKPIADLNFTRVFRETSIDITVDGPMNREFLNSQTFQKVQTVKLPKWVPPFFVPPPRVVRDVTNLELLTAGAIAGSVVEIVRTSLLYPLLTLKTRIQTDVNVGLRKRSNRRLQLRRRLKISRLKARKHVREGNLYAGVWPSLLISVPATGVYFGMRDIAIRKLIPYTDALGGGLSVALVAALVADVVSLIIRTPADTLAIRLQSATGEASEWEEAQGAEVSETERRYYLQEKIGNWFLESLERVPAVIVTDLPFLLSRIALNRILLQGGPVSLGRYEGIVIVSAIMCSLLTTPFDVARTRILVDSDGDPTNGDDGGSGEGLVRTFQRILDEGDGGVRNLFAGWLERVAYFGLGRAWIEPLQILGYIAIRDFILLEWF